MFAGRYQIIAGPFRRRSGQDGGGDLHKAMVDHSLTKGPYHLAAQDHVLFNGRIAQVQIAVLKALSLIRVPAAVDLEGKLVIIAAA